MTDPREELLNRSDWQITWHMPKVGGAIDWYSTQVIQSVAEEIGEARWEADELLRLADAAEVLNREAIQRHLEVSLEDAYPEDEP